MEGFRSRGAPKGSGLSTTRARPHSCGAVEHSQSRFLGRRTRAVEESPHKASAVASDASRQTGAFSTDACYSHKSSAISHHRFHTALGQFCGRRQSNSHSTDRQGDAEGSSRAKTASRPTTRLGSGLQDPHIGAHHKARGGDRCCHPWSWFKQYIDASRCEGGDTEALGSETDDG